MTARIRDISCVDLFCGVGGLTHGLERGGVRVSAGIDVDEDCRYPYESNNPSAFIRRDVRELTAKELLNLYCSSPIQLLAGCAPCQSFSTYSRIGRSKRRDNLWPLLNEFGRLVRQTQPHIVTMENVPQLASHEVFQTFLRQLTGYQINYHIVECAQYGVPQTRKRLVLLASRLGPIRLIEPEEWKSATATVRAAIASFPPLAAGQRDPLDPLHAACRLSDINLRRIRASKPGGTWRDWDPSLLAACHKRPSGGTFPSVYGRMSWDEPSPTITTQCFGYGNGRFGHPTQDRAISLREAASLQTFPREYKFIRKNEAVRFQVLGRLIGNAVPVLIGEVIARSIKNHLEANWKQSARYAVTRKSIGRTSVKCAS